MWLDSQLKAELESHKRHLALISKKFDEYLIHINNQKCLLIWTMNNIYRRKVIKINLLKQNLGLIKQLNKKEKLQEKTNDSKLFDHDTINNTNLNTNWTNKNTHIHNNNNDSTNQIKQFKKCVNHDLSTMLEISKLNKLNKLNINTSNKMNTTKTKTNTHKIEIKKEKKEEEEEEMMKLDLSQRKINICNQRKTKTITRRTSTAMAAMAAMAAVVSPQISQISQISQIPQMSQTANMTKFELAKIEKSATNTSENKNNNIDDNNCMNKNKQRVNKNKNSIYLNGNEYYCKYCNIGFTNKISLDKHNKCHFAQKHCCPYCKEKFNTNDNFYKHLKNKHRQKYLQIIKHYNL